jgi:hypothetical protein
VHMNSIAVDVDGNLILSSRHLSEITKIDRRTGDVLWRLGGKYNQFQFTGGGYGPSYQHCVRTVEGHPGRITMFDNGNSRSPQYSRAVEFALDAPNKTASTVWEYRHKPDRYSYWMGSVQRFPNGNTLIDWADQSLPKATEVTASGEVLLEADFVAKANCYRTQRFDWSSVMQKPYLIAESQPDRVALIFNKFGDRKVKQYIVYGGRRNTQLMPLDTTSETVLYLSNLVDKRIYQFKVCAVDSSGSVSPFSNIEEVYVSYALPGENVVVNGDFSNDSSGWQFLVRDEASAAGAVVNGEFRVQVGSGAGGAEYWKIQLIQEGIRVIQGRKYRLEFDAHADANRPVEPRVAQNGGNFTNYAKTNATVIKRLKAHYTFDFTMEDPTDYQARVVLNSGTSDVAVYFDNVSFSEVDSSPVRAVDGDKPAAFELLQSYPNPFNPRATVRFTLEKDVRVRLTVFNTLGRKVATLTDGTLAAGRHQAVFDAGGLPGGLYWVRMETGSCSQTRKMLYLK